VTHKEGRIGDLSTAFNTGLTIGAFTWGLLVDILGVRPVFLGFFCKLMISGNGVSISPVSSLRYLGSCLQVSLGDWQD
jgi:MFS family permease